LHAAMELEDEDTIFDPKMAVLEQTTAITTTHATGKDSRCNWISANLRRKCCDRLRADANCEGTAMSSCLSLCALHNVHVVSCAVCIGREGKCVLDAQSAKEKLDKTLNEVHEQ
jgi:hypothetical protein